VVVPDPQGALGELARHVLGGLTASVVALTGSQGKTGTKDLVAHVLARVGTVVATEGSENNELGLPLTVLRATPGTEYVVLEMGARGAGHLTYLCRIAPPEIAVNDDVWLQRGPTVLVNARWLCGAKLTLTDGPEVGVVDDHIVYVVPPDGETIDAHALSGHQRGLRCQSEPYRVELHLDRLPAGADGLALRARHLGIRRHRRQARRRTRERSCLGRAARRDHAFRGHADENGALIRNSPRSMSYRSERDPASA